MHVLEKIPMSHFFINNVLNKFEKVILKGFIESFKNEGTWFGTYKIQELKKFIRFLFYLFEDDSI